MTDRGSIYVVKGASLTVGTHPIATVSYAEYLGGPAELAGNDASAGDLNADGNEDVLVGAQGDHALGTGAAYVLRGPLPSGQANLADVAVVRFTPSGQDRGLGQAVEVIPSINADMRDEILIGSNYDDPLTGKETGAAYLFLNNRTP